MLNRLPILLPTAAVLAVAFVLACADSTGPSVPQYPHTAAAMRLVSGDSQTTTVGTKFAQPFVFEVLDSVGQPAWGRQIIDGDGDSAITDRNGRATMIVSAGTVAHAGADKFEPTQQGYSAATTVNAYVTVLPGPLARIDTVVTYTHMPALDLSTSEFPRNELFTPVDSFGNEVAWPATTWTLPAGWTVRGDTVVPPTTGAVGKFSLSIQAGAISAKRSLVLFDDLRQYRWKVTWACGGGVPSGSSSTDSLLFVGTVRSMAYPGDPGYYQGPQGDLPGVQPFVDGQLTIVDSSGISTTRTMSNMSVIGMSQVAVDTLAFPYDANMGTPTGKIAVRQGGALPMYTGGSWCYGFARRWPVTLTTY